MTKKCKQQTNTLSVYKVFKISLIIYRVINIAHQHIRYQELYHPFPGRSDINRLCSQLGTFVHTT